MEIYWVKVWRGKLRQQKYLSLLSLVDGMIGNSSSALIEAPSLNTAAINIGDRQKGRTRSKNIIDCQNNQNAIKKAFPKVYLFNSTPIHKALWNIASNCIAVKREEGTARYFWQKL